MLDYGVQTPNAPLVGLTGKIPAKKGALRNLFILGQPLPENLFPLVDLKLHGRVLHLDPKHYRNEQI